MASNIAQVFILEELKIKDVYVDFTVNAWNMQAVNFLKRHGVKYFCSSPELSLDKNRAIFQNESVIHLLGGFPSCVYTRNCFKNSLGCESCSTGTKQIKNFDRNINFEINCFGDHRELTYTLPILNIVNFQQDNESFRYITGDEPIEIIKKNIEMFLQDDYYRTARKMPEWANSFTNMLMEDN